MVYKISVRALGVVALVITAAAVPVKASVVWSESVNGELNDLYQYSHPTPAVRGAWTDLGVLTLGTSTMVGSSIQTSGSFSNFFDGDAMKITVPAGMELSQLLFTHDKAAGMREFFNITGTTAAPYYVFRNFPATHMPIGTQDLLTFFNPPGGVLGPGDYVVSFDNSTFNTTMQYSLDLVVIPSPSVAGLVVCAGVIGARRRRK